MIWVLTLRADWMPHDLSWYFDVKEEADAAHALALRSSVQVVAFHEDYLTDSHELSVWLLAGGRG